MLCCIHQQENKLNVALTIGPTGILAFRKSQLAPVLHVVRLSETAFTLNLINEIEVSRINNY